jgi:FimV-like protein
MALLRANPQAFIDNNINKLRAGAVLNIPSLAFIEELDPQTARAQFAEQTRRRQPAVATSPRSLPAAPAQLAPEPAPRQSSEQATETATKPPAEDEASDPLLRIVSDEGEQAESATTAQDLQDKLLVTMEEIESNRLTTDAIESRLTRLEAEIERMQQLVELKDAQIAALQSEVQTRDDIEVAAGAAEPRPPAAARMASDGADTIDVEPVAAPTPVVSIESVTPAAAPTAATKSWEEQYLWMIWVLIAILGLTILALLLRRPQQPATQAAAAVLPAVAAGTAATRAAPAPEKTEMRNAEQDLRDLADAQLPEHEPPEPAEPELPEIDNTRAAGKETLRDHDEITDSVLAEMLEESRLVPEKLDSYDRETDFDDDDIASWIKELGHETEPGESHSANDEQLSDDEIPSILTELDDQLGASSPPEISQPAKINLEPFDEPVAEPPLEDDTFTMSLDLARAYLEIGDQEGAKDMLKQALSGTRDPEHRRQILELLEQID